MKKILLLFALVLVLFGCDNTNEPSEAIKKLTPDEASKKLYQIVIMEKYDLDLVKQYVEVGADVNYADPKDKGTVFHYATGYTQHSGQRDVVEYMLEQGADVKVLDQNGETPLFAAVATNDPVLVQMLIDAGAEVNATDQRGRTALHLAVRPANDEAIDGNTTYGTLLAAGAKHDVRDDTGETPIFTAVTGYMGNLNALKEMVKAGADINLSNEDGNTPLHYSSSDDSQIKQVSYLVSKGAKVNVQNKFGETPLYLAVSEGEAQSIQTLLRAGADVSLKTKEGMTVFDLLDKARTYLDKDGSASKGIALKTDAELKEIRGLLEAARK